MKEIPILFNGAMVRAILEGRKTQTRRPFKVHHDVEDFWSPHKYYELHESDKGGELVPNSYWCGDEGGHRSYKSPFGKPGDVLWVRETCLISPPNFVDQCNATHDNGVIVQYLATDPDREAASDYGVTKATPSIHMPKWACRLKLKVKRVWVERVQDITEEHAFFEGICEACGYEPSFEGICEACGYEPSDCTEICNKRNPEMPCASDPIEEFMELWDSIYGTWAENPWVWCCEFEV
jgi:hypothetical protein